MANFTGMDIPGVRALSSQMNQSAGQIRQLMATPGAGRPTPAGPARSSEPPQPMTPDGGDP
jgi:hypothetical protein